MKTVIMRKIRNCTDNDI